MLKRSGLAIFLFIFLSLYCQGQTSDPGPGYQMLLTKNPALSGSDGSGAIRLSYLNFYPGNNYNLHSIYFSYDSYFQQLHGGASIFISDDYLGGIINDLRAGLSYAYFLQAGKDLFINAGLSASLYHRGFNFGSAVLPDQIDPLGGVTIPSSEALASAGKTVFDIGAGFLFISGKFSGGLSVSHLAEPNLSDTDLESERIKRMILFHLTGDFAIARSGTISIQPLIYSEMQSGYSNGGAGAAIAGKNLALNAIILGDTEKNVNIQTGFSVAAGKLTFYYNYRFNVASGNKFMPLSLLHQTGLAFSLNNVEKRNANKTINFPKL